MQNKRELITKLVIVNQILQNREVGYLWENHYLPFGPKLVEEKLRLIKILYPESWRLMI